MLNFCYIYLQFLIRINRDDETVACFLTQDHDRSGRKPLLSMNTTIIKVKNFNFP